MSSKGKESKSPASAAKENKSPDKLLTTKSTRANEKNPFYLSKTGPLGGQNDKLPPDHQSDISNNSEHAARHKRTSQQIKSTTESHGKTSLPQPKATPQKSAHQRTFQTKPFQDLEKVPDSTQKSGVNSKPQLKDTPQKSGVNSKQQPKATHQKSLVTSNPHQVTFQANPFPDLEENTKKKQTSSPLKPKKDEKQTSSSARGPFAPK